MARYSDVSGTLRRLERFLPKKNPLDSLSEEEEWDVRAYVLMSHAAVEAAVEGLCLAIVSKVRAGVESGHFGVAAMSLILKYCMAVNEATLIGHSRGVRVDNLVLARAAISHYENYVRAGNHGIKKKNLRALLEPLGIDVDSLDEYVVDMLDQLGEKRGQVAHDLKGGIGLEYHPEAVIEWVRPFHDTKKNVLEHLAKALGSAAT